MRQAMHAINGDLRFVLRTFVDDRLREIETAILLAHEDSDKGLDIDEMDELLTVNRLAWYSQIDQTPITRPLLFAWKS